jgi:hypothetical protein
LFLAGGLGTVVAVGSAPAASVGPIGTYYVLDASLGGVMPERLLAVHGTTSASTDMTLDFSKNVFVDAGPIAIHGNLIATTGVYGDSSRHAQTGEILSGAPGLTLTDTGVYPTNTTTTDQFIDGTTDGTYNYMIGYGASASGTIYRAGADWSNPTPVANMGVGGFVWTGITYDPTDHSFWVLGSATARAGLYFLYQIGIPSTPGIVDRIHTTVINGDPNLDALAMDVDGTLWMTQVGTGRMVHYTTGGTYLGDFTPDNPATRSLGAEIAMVPSPIAAAGALPLLGGLLAVNCRRKKSRRDQ